MFKEILQKSITGFFFGLGAAIAAIFMILLYETYDHRLKMWLDSSNVHYSRDELPQLVIMSHKQREDTEYFTVVGNIKNTGDMPLKDISVKIEIVDGDFILGTCSGHVDGGQYVNKNQKGSFSINCRNVKTNENKYPYNVFVSYAVGFEK